jgi:hypothetical protein
MSDDRRPKILLSLDGGGVKGLSQLDILAEIIRRIKDKLRADSGNHSLAADEGLKDDQIYPCEYFVSQGLLCCIIFSYNRYRISSSVVERAESTLFSLAVWDYPSRSA